VGAPSLVDDVYVAIEAQMLGITGAFPTFHNQSTLYLKPTQGMLTSDSVTTFFHEELKCEQLWMGNRRISNQDAWDLIIERKMGALL
jgi:hypothetical protein